MGFAERLIKRAALNENFIEMGRWHLFNSLIWLAIG